MSNVPTPPLPPSPTPVPQLSTWEILKQLASKNQLLVAVVVLLIGGFGYSQWKNSASNNSSPFGPTPSPFNVTPVVVKPQASNDLLSKLYNATNTNPNSYLYCSHYAALFEASAKQLQSDGTQQTPVIKTREQVLTFIRQVGQLEQSVVPKGSYPALSQILASTFAEGFPAQGGPLTPDDRTLAVNKLLTLSDGFQKMADYYKKNPPKNTRPF